MRGATVLFGGLGMSARVLAKFAAVYGSETLVAPLTFTCLVAREAYAPYRALDAALREPRHGGPVHVHALSGACHYVYRFMSLYPGHRARVASQVYDAPCHVDGAAAFLETHHGVPRRFGDAAVRALLADCAATSEAWSRAPFFPPHIPTGLVVSSRDAISPAARIDEMMAAWRLSDVRTLETDSMHLESLRDRPDAYRALCLETLRRGRERAG
jgi:hypothetical protein